MADGLQKDYYSYYLRMDRSPIPAALLHLLLLIYLVTYPLIPFACLRCTVHIVLGPNYGST